MLNTVQLIIYQMADLGAKQVQYNSAQAELHALYERIFDGPSQGEQITAKVLVSSRSTPTAFPEDDRLEYDLNDAIKRHNNILGVMNSESRAAEILALAANQMDYCQANMKEALSYSTYGESWHC